MDSRIIIFIAALTALGVATPVSAQRLHSGTGPAPAPAPVVRKVPPPLPPTPLQCDQHRAVPHVHAYCVSAERALVQGESRRRGAPTPSDQVVNLPPMGSTDAKALGAACIGGTGMRRLANGWEQLRDRQCRWLRCREG